MRLIGFGPGEICDRLSILALKIHYSRQHGKPIAHFEEEQAELMALAHRPDSLNVQHVLELAAINGGIWHEEDKLRAIRLGLPAEFGNEQHLRVSLIAFRLQTLNDRRHALIRLINQDAGHDAPEEKVT